MPTDLDVSQYLPFKRHPPQPRFGLRDARETPLSISQCQSRLFRLPLEMRNRIYAFTMGETRLVHVRSDSRKYTRPGFPCPKRDTYSGECACYRCEDEVYTHDLYLDACLETTDEDEFYRLSQSRQEMQPEVSQLENPFKQRHFHCLDRRRLQGPKIFEAALLRTCRQIYQEATTVLWRSLVFSFESHFTLTSLISQLTPLQKYSLTSIHVMNDRESVDNKHWLWDPETLMTDLASLTALRNLHTGIFNWPVDGSAQLQLERLLNGSLWIWEHEIQYFRRQSLKHVTVVLEEVYSSYANNYLDTQPWTNAEKAQFSAALVEMILAA